MENNTAATWLAKRYAARYNAAQTDRARKAAIAAYENLVLKLGYDPLA